VHPAPLPHVASNRRERVWNPRTGFIEVFRVVGFVAGVSRTIADRKQHGGRVRARAGVHCCGKQYDKKPRCSALPKRSIFRAWERTSFEILRLGTFGPGAGRGPAGKTPGTLVGTRRRCQGFSSQKGRNEGSVCRAPARLIRFDERLHHSFSQAGLVGATRRTFGAEKQSTGR